MSGVQASQGNDLVKPWECPITFESMAADAMSVEVCGHKFSKVGILDSLQRVGIEWSEDSEELIQNLKTKTFLCPSCNGRVTLIKVDHQFRDLAKLLEAQDKQTQEKQTQNKQTQDPQQSAKPPEPRKIVEQSQAVLEEAEKKIADVMDVGPVPLTEEEIESKIVRRRELRKVVVDSQRDAMKFAGWANKYGGISELGAYAESLSDPFQQALEKKKTALSELEQLVREIEGQKNLTYFVLEDECPSASAQFTIEQAYIDDQILHVTLMAPKCSKPYMYLGNIGSDKIEGKFLIIPEDPNSQKRVRQEFKINIEDIYFIAEELNMSRVSLEITRDNTSRAVVDLASGRATLLAK